MEAISTPLRQMLVILVVTTIFAVHSSSDSHRHRHHHSPNLHGAASSGKESDTRYPDIYMLSGNENDWWEVEQTTETLFDGLSKYKIFLRSSDIDDGGVHSCYQYQVVSKLTGLVEYVNSFCYPSLVITAYRKSGSSAAYALLSKYPHVLTSHTKENCPYILGVSLIQYFESLPNSVESGELILDGCVDLKGNMKMRKILRNPNTLYIVLTRNYADWIWSAYNYWCQPHYDGPTCDVGNYWVDSEVHVRSPEMFHDIVQGALNGTAVSTPLLFKDPCQHSSSLFRTILTYLWQFTEPIKTLVLASEELETHPVITWNRIMKAIGIKEPHPGLNDFMGQRVNSGNVKGAGSTIPLNEYRPGLYAVSKNQPLLAKTREILDKCWKSDCIYTSMATNHNYSSCNAGDMLAMPEIAQGISEDPVNVNLSIYLRDVVDSPGDDSTAFLYLKHSRCNASFHRELKPVVDEKLASVSIPETTVSTTAAENIIKGVAIVGPSTKDRALLRKLIYFATGYDRIVDLEESKHHHHDLKAVCRMPHIVVSVAPASLTLHNSTVGQTPYLFSERLNSQCNGFTIIFEHIVVLLRDALNSVWTTYQLNHGYPNGILESGTAASFNWTDWEISSIAMLQSQKNASAVVNADFNVWTAEQSEMIESIHADNKFHSRLENLMYSDAKVFHLYELIEFLKEGLYSSSLGPQHEYKKHNQGNRYKDSGVHKLPVLQSTKKALQCAHVLHKGGGLSKRDQLVGAGNLNLAYASNDLVCQIEHLFKNSRLMLLTLESSSTYNASCVNGRTTNKDISRKCQLRYSQRGLIKNIVQHPIALLVRAGTEQMLQTRLLWEYNTGLQSGSMETDKRLSRFLPGDIFCGLRLSVIHADPYDTTIKSTKGGKPTISMTNKGKQKCRRGMVRGFDRGAFIAQDPFATVWLRWRAGIVGNETHLADMTPSPVNRVLGLAKEYADIVRSLSDNDRLKMKAGLLEIAFDFKEADLNLHTSLWDIKFNHFEKKDILILSYESLMMVPSALYEDMYDMPRTNTLLELLKFGGYPMISREKVQCAYTLLPRSQYNSELTLMDAFFRSEPQLICALQRAFNSVLEEYQDYKFIRLYTDIVC